MADLEREEVARSADILFFHFDVQDHYLSLETFVRTAESARRVIEALDKTFFNEELDYELIVMPPEEGTFLSKLALWVMGGAGTVFAFINSDVGAAFVEGLTGYPPSYWAIEAGKAAKGAINGSEEPAEPDMEQEERSPSAKRVDETTCRESARITVEMTRAILESSSEKLEEVGMAFGALPEALEARADFYSACIDNRAVSAVGFTPADDFPIPRNSFPERAIPPKRTEPDDVSPEWVIAVESIYVTSPNWDEEDQKARQWKGKDQARRDCYFVIEDQEFWSLVKRRTLHVEVLDNLKVQWAYQIVDNKPKSRRVLRVLEFNSEKLAEPLEDDAIKAILGEYSSDRASRREPSLFDNDD